MLIEPVMQPNSSGHLAPDASESTKIRRNVATSAGVARAGGTNVTPLARSSVAARALIAGDSSDDASTRLTAVAIVRELSNDRRDLARDPGEDLPVVRAACDRREYADRDRVCH